MKEEVPRDYDSSDEDLRILMRIIASSLGKKDVQIGYSEGTDNGLLKWVLGLIATLTATFIVGGVVLYGKVSAIEANQVNQQRQLDQLSATVATGLDPRSEDRGGEGSRR